jgi:GT2 family glycosyltransferase
MQFVDCTVFVLVAEKYGFVLIFAQPLTPRVTFIEAVRESAAIGNVIVDLQRYRYRVVVDDGSQDGTGAIAAKVGATVITHAVNLGQGAALQTGIEYALKRGPSAVIPYVDINASGRSRAAFAYPHSSKEVARRVSARLRSYSPKCSPRGSREK